MIQYAAVITNGKMVVRPGKHPRPDITIMMKEDDCLNMENGRLDGTRAVSTGKIKIEGDLDLALHLHDVCKQVPRNGSPVASVHRAVERIAQRWTFETTKKQNVTIQLNLTTASTPDELQQVLRKATDEEIIGLRRLLWGPEAEEALEPWVDDLQDRLQRLASSTLGYLLAEKRYPDIVREALNHLDVKHAEDTALDELEGKLVRKFLQTVWKRMSPEQRVQMERELAIVAEQLDPGWARSLTAGGLWAALTAAQVSGFGVYLATTTALGVISHGLGMTLPFVAYTGLSRAIAVVIGPPGWIFTILTTIFLLDRPNYRKLIPALIYIAALRSQQRYREQQSFHVQHKQKLQWGAVLLTVGVLLFVLAVRFLPAPPPLPTLSSLLPAATTLATVLPALLSIGITWHVGTILRVDSEPPLQPQHYVAGIAMLAVGLSHLFLPFPSPWLAWLVFLPALGMFTYCASHLYRVIFGRDGEEPITLQPLASFVAKLDARFTKERVFTLFLVLAAVALWGAIQPIPLGVSAAGFLCLLLLLFYAGERVYQHAGAMLGVLAAAFLLSIHCRVGVLRLFSLF